MLLVDTLIGPGGAALDEGIAAADNGSLE